jgi:GNAT superfamily N-acetyltransferase
MTIELRRLDRARMTDAQFDALVAVVLDAPAYSMAVEGKLPSADDVPAMMTDVPPGYPLSDKYFFGIYRDDAMIGCADVLRGWKFATQSMIGLLLLAQPFQRCGYGALAYRRLEETIGAWQGMESIRIGIIETNLPAFGFWHRMGFAETGERSRLAQYIGDAVILEKRLR